MTLRTPGQPMLVGALQHATAARSGYIPVELPVGSQLRGPVHAGDQGVSQHERANAEGIMLRLFEAPGVDMVVFYDAEKQQYELRSRKGVIRWQRWSTPNGELRYRIVYQAGENPIPDGDPARARSLAQEIQAAGGEGRPVPRELNSYPDLLEQLSQIFDHRRAPDLAYIPTPGGDPNHPGTGSHGVPDAVQSRAPLVIAGPGIQSGVITEALARHIDVAPTVAEMLGVNSVLGTNATGVLRNQLLRWQDGKSLTPALANAQRGTRLIGNADRAIMFAVDGMSQTVMFDEIAKGNLPNMARIIARGTTFANGTVASYPTVTWTNHNTLLTGARPGHNGIVNNSWYDRETKQERLITDGGAKNSLRTHKLLDPQVETLYEAVKRTFPQAQTIAVNQPAGRGADVSVLDLVGVGSMLSILPKVAIGTLKSWFKRDKAVDSISGWRQTALQDAAAGAIGTAYWSKRNPPKLSVFEFTQVDNRGHYEGPQSEHARRALREVDKEIGRVMSVVEQRGKLDSTAIVLTADHGMEHQDRDVSKTGGWTKSLTDAKKDGNVALDSTRFIYIQSMRHQVTTAVPRIGENGVLGLSVVDDDTDTNGTRKPIAGASVVIRDASGNEWRGVTNADGTVSVNIEPKSGPLTITVEQDGFSRSESTIDLAN